MLSKSGLCPHPHLHHHVLMYLPPLYLLHASTVSPSHMSRNQATIIPYLHCCNRHPLAPHFQACLMTLSSQRENLSISLPFLVPFCLQKKIQMPEHGPKALLDPALGFGFCSSTPQHAGLGFGKGPAVCHMCGTCGSLRLCWCFLPGLRPLLCFANSLW